MDLLKLLDPRESRVRALSRPDLESDRDEDSGIEDEPRAERRDSIIFVAFKGDINDQDLHKKLEKIMHGVPELINMECNRLKLQKVEPWNSVRVTFNIPREAAERLRLLAQGNNQQLRDLGILSVQIEGEGAINIALVQTPAQEVRMNGPMAASNAMRIDPAFAVQGRAGLIRMNNPAAAGTMMSQGPHVSSSMMAAGGSAELLQPRTPRPSSQQDAMDPLVSGLTVQQQNHPSGSMTPQLHPMQAVVGNRPANAATFQQFQQQARLPQHQQVTQGIRPSFAAPTQVPVPPGWNQLASGALQPPPAQGNMGAVAPNQQWKKSLLGAGGQLQQQQQFQQRPSLSAVQTPSHPPPPYPFGSQQASQVHSNFPSMANSNQFSSPSMKPMQGGPPRVLTPLQQPHLSKSPASSPSFQQSSPASSPTVNQTQPQAMGPRPGQGNSLPQGFQQQTVSSPGRSSVMPQGSTAGNFMMQLNQGPQGIHAGVPKRLPPVFTAGQTNANFLQGQTPPSTAGSPTNGATAQQQVTAAGQGAGGQANGSSHGQLQGSHGGTNVMQTNLIGLHNNLNNLQTSGSGVSQVNIGGMHSQAQQGPQSQMLGMHQQIISSQAQMVNLQGQASLNTQGQLVLSRTQLMSQGQMLAGSQNLGQPPQRMTPPKQMMPSHSQMMTAQNQAMMQQNPVMEQIMQGNKQGFNTQNSAGVMAGPSQIIRGPAPGMPNNMVQFSGQGISQQGTVGGNPSQGVNIQNQVLRQAGPGQHLQQTHAESSAQATGDLGTLLPDLPMQQTGNMASQHAQHLQNMPGNNGPGQHFAGHGLPFNSPFGQGGSGNQLACGQNQSFPVNKDVTLTSPLLVNLLQSDISAGHFGVNSKQNTAAAKPKKKKPPRKKKNQQGEEHMNAAESRMEESDQSGIVGDQLGALDAGQKLSEFQNRPPGYPTQGLEQRQLQQIPQLMQLGQQQGQSGQNQQPTPPQQMMMMLMMQQQQQQQQQQEQKTVRLPLQQNVFNPRAAMNTDAQRMPMQQGGSMQAMVNLQNTGSITPSPDKQRMAMLSNSSLGGNGRKMGFPESGQNQTGSPLGDGPSAGPLGDIPELSTAPGSQNNMAPHMLMPQNPMMMAGSKPGTPSALSLTQGTSPQQQHSNTMGGSHGHHYQNVQTPSQTSRPKTPNRASPRPYYPQTPNNRPPSTEPSEISLSPERLNASIAGLFPPQINIPLPPRPTLNRGFDQQGLNPTTLKAIGQAPPGLTVNNQSTFVSHLNKMDNGAGKPPTAGGNKRASPSNSRRSSPASSRKTTPSPGRQNSKTPKMVLGGQQTPGMLHSMEMQRNLLAGQPSVQLPQAAPTIGQYPPPIVPSTAVTTEEIKESSSLIQENENQTMQMIHKEHPVAEHKTDVRQEMKMVSPEELAKKEALFLEGSKLPRPEELSALSPAIREAPTSLSQLLDHSGAPNVNIKPPDQLLETSILLPTEDSKTMDVASLPGDSLKDSACVSNTHPFPEASNVQPRTDTVENNTNVPLNLPGNTLKRSGGPAPASTSMTPNQITVFVTSNPITPSASVSTPMASQLQPTLVPTVVTMASVANKVIVSEGQPPVQSNTRQQFITPVFFNSSSIIQVMKGSQQNNMPPSNTNMMPQSVAVVGPLHISKNIQFPGPSSSTSPSSNTNNVTTTRSALTSPVQMSGQLAPSQSPSPLPQPPAKMQYSSDDLSTQLGSASDLSSPVNVKPTLSPTLGSNVETSGSKFQSTPSMGQDHMESSEAGCPSMGGPGRSPSMTSQTSTESNSTSALSMDPIVHRSSTPVDLLPFPSPNPPMMLLAEKSSEGTLAEQISTTFDDTVPEQILETVFPQNPGPEEGTSTDNQNASEKRDADTQENMECEPGERSRPPSRRNSRVEEFPMPQDILESGQRKRVARPSIASNSVKESGASPTQSKRRKSK
ncbi:PREDICTED: nuclear receptor coactivator 6 [Nanorana parkeri]|uniref:nuclear receptor coactivator 6 n=1 Tax=Nanorana parkeri TaxID=125878 RepID=UPI000854DDB9|nr:PREDICTED: nuclear receptor coactivator 6 [Nanorana parkeri]